MWLRVDGFKEVVKGWWQGMIFSGFFSFVIAEKLKALKAILKTWNREVFSRVEAKKSGAPSRVSY